jgi:hypothetical protein
LPSAACSLLKQHDLGFLATLRKDGSPRLHPVCPNITDDGLYVFVVGISWKYRDLLRDPRYALRFFPGDEDEEFYCGGDARAVEDGSIYEAVVANHPNTPQENEKLFELKLDRALHTTWNNWGKPDISPNYTRWTAAGGRKDGS